MKVLLFLCWLLFSCINSFAQEKDSIGPQKTFETSLFADDDTLTHSDYLLDLGKVFQVVNKATSLSQPVPAIILMVQHMNEDDSSLASIKERIAVNNQAINVRNLQTFNILLSQIKKDTRAYSKALNQYDSILDKTKKDIFDLRQDTVLKHIFKESSLKDLFKTPLQELALKWGKADSVIKFVNVLIDNSLAHASNNLITADELQLKTESLEASTGTRAFTKERPYLWEVKPPDNTSSHKTQYRPSLYSENKITAAYFTHTHFQFILLFLSGLIFFFWIFFNFNSLLKRNKLHTAEKYHLTYVHKYSFIASAIFMLNIAPLFDLDAPVIYIESIEFLLMMTLTLLFIKQLPRKLLHLWFIFIALFLLSFLKYAGISFYISRWLSFALNSASFVFGIYAVIRYRRKYGNEKILLYTVFLYTLFNALAVASNLSGRVTFMQIFSSTAIYAIIQTISLIVFKKAVAEAFLLQIQSSRVRKDYPETFDHDDVLKGISRMINFCAVLIWLVVFITNLNLYDTVFENITALLSTPRLIGSFTFTLGGLFLFLAIMWFANFLQKYIAYFFGDIGDDAAFNNKVHRSRLLITRLVLLVGGFLLAIAASGLAVDRITVILGALGVGIGLGLQSIVNNFVSGIILIFDRTLRIGDTVEIGDRKGRVKEISVRSSTLLTPDGAEVIIPNGDILSHNIVNWTLSNNNIRVEVDFTVDKFISADDILPGIRSIVHASPDVLTNRDPEVFVNNITAQSTQLKIYFWCKDVTKIERSRNVLYSAIYKHLEEKGIKIL